MRIKIQKQEAGLHPSEVIVTIATVSGTQELVVDTNSAKQNSIDVGSPIAKRGDAYLVELPSETSNGKWRVWITRDSTIEEAMEAAE